MTGGAPRGSGRPGGGPGGRPGRPGGRPGGRPSGGGRPGSDRGGRGPGDGRRGGPSLRPPGPRRIVPSPPPEAGEVEEMLLEARGIAAAGDLKAALAAAGEAVRRDTERPEGYVVLGDLNLEFGDLLEADRCYAAAAEKARVFGRDAAEIATAAAIGKARVRRIEGDFVAANAAYRAVLAADPTDGAGVGAEAAEAAIASGDAVFAAGLLAPLDAAAPDEHFIAHVVLGRIEREAEAVVRGRLALFGNLYLLAALIEDEPPELGLVHGFEEATPEYAADAAERLRPWLEDDPDAADGLAALASTPTVSAEVGRFVEIAKTLQREGDPARRQALLAELSALRDESRLIATTGRVLEEIAADLAPDDRPCRDEDGPDSVFPV